MSEEKKGESGTPEEDLVLSEEQDAVPPGQMRKVAALPKQPRPKSSYVQRQLVVSEEKKKLSLIHI